MKDDSSDNYFSFTLGDKIRKYRKLKGWTQKQLGVEIGFSDTTADSRIRKYESNIMAPKTEIRQKLAEKLDVDISALSDNSINSVEDIMQILFYLEEEYGMTVDRDENKTTLSFDNNMCPSDKYGLFSDTKKYDLFANYLNAWYGKNKSLNPDDPDSETEYLKWKARFPDNFEEVKKVIDDKNNIPSETTTITISTPEDKEKLSRFIDENIDKGPVRVTFG